MYIELLAEAKGREAICVSSSKSVKFRLFYRYYENSAFELLFKMAGYRTCAHLLHLVMALYTYGISNVGFDFYGNTRDVRY